MLIYNVCLLVNILAGLIFLYSPFFKERLGINLYLIFTFLELTFLGGLRALSIGTDTAAYLELFALIKETKKITELLNLNFEIGYVFLNKIIAILGGNGQTLLFITSAIISFGFIIFIKNNSRNILLSVFLLITLYYYYASFNAIRQYIAIVIVINSFSFIKQKNFLMYLLFIIVAALFHLSSLFIFPLYLLGLIQWTIRKFIVFIILIALIYLNLESLVTLAIKIFPQYSSYIGTNYLQGYSGKMYLVVNLTIFFFLVIVYLAKKGYQNNYTTFLLTIGLLISTLTIYATKIYFANRIGWYLTPFNIILIPHFLALINENKIRETTLVLIITMGIAYHTYCLSVNLHRIVPYIYYWDYQLKV